MLKSKKKTQQARVNTASAKQLQKVQVTVVKTVFLIPEILIAQSTKQKSYAHFFPGLIVKKSGPNAEPCFSVGNVRGKKQGSAEGNGRSTAS